MQNIEEILAVLDTLLKLTLSLFAIYLPNLSCFHIVLDGFYGHEEYVNLAIQNKLSIISKFKKMPIYSFNMMVYKSKMGDPKNLEIK